MFTIKIEISTDLIPKKILKNPELFQKMKIEDTERIQMQSGTGISYEVDGLGLLSLSQMLILIAILEANHLSFALQNKLKAQAKKGDVIKHIKERLI